MKSGVHFSMPLLHKQTLQKYPKCRSPIEKLTKTPVRESDTSTPLTVKPTTESLLIVKSRI